MQRVLYRNPRYNGLMAVLVITWHSHLKMKISLIWGTVLLWNWKPDPLRLPLALNHWPFLANFQ